MQWGKMNQMLFMDLSSAKIIITLWVDYVHIKFVNSLGVIL